VSLTPEAVLARYEMTECLEMAAMGCSAQVQAADMETLAAKLDAVLVPH
jgi:hypothetical protein